MKKSTSRASRSAVYAAAGISIITPIGTCRNRPAALTEIRCGFRHDAARFADLLDARHERKHDAERAVTRRSQQRAQLRPQQLRTRQAQTQPAQALPASPLFLGNPAARQRGIGRSQRELILVDVERPDRHRSQAPSPRASRDTPRIAGLRSEAPRCPRQQELRSVQADAFGACVTRGRQIAWELDVRIEANAHAVGRDRRPPPFGVDVRGGATVRIVAPHRARAASPRRDR